MAAADALGRNYIFALGRFQYNRRPGLVVGLFVGSRFCELFFHMPQPSGHAYKPVRLGKGILLHISPVSVSLLAFGIEFGYISIPIATLMALGLSGGSSTRVAPNKARAVLLAHFPSSIICAMKRSRSCGLEVDGSVSRGMAPSGLGKQTEIEVFETTPLAGTSGCRECGLWQMAFADGSISAAVEGRRDARWWGGQRGLLFRSGMVLYKAMVHGHADVGVAARLTFRNCL